MSFGWSATDIAALLKLAKQTYDRFKDAPEQFRAFESESVGPQLVNIIVLSLVLIERRDSGPSFVTWTMSYPNTEASPSGRKRL